MEASKLNLPLGTPSISLRVKATGVVLFLQCVTLAIAAGASIVTMREQSLAEHARAAASMAMAVADASRLSVFSGDVDEVRRLAEGICDQDSVSFIGVFRKDGTVLGHAASDPDAWREFSAKPYVYQANGSVQRGIGTDRYTIAGDVIEALSDASASDMAADGPASPARSGGGSKVIGYAVVGLNTAPLHAAVTARQNDLLSMFGLITLASLLPVWLIVGNWANRISSLASVARRIAAGDFDTPVDDRRPDEIGRLAATFEFMRTSVAGRDQQMRALAASLHDQVGERTQELEHRSEDLQRALVASEAASRAKSDFLANMSHEIRTPMTAILGYADLLSDVSQSPEERSAAVHTIKRSGDHLLSILNDILDLSKIEAGKFTVEQIPCSPLHIVSDVASLLRPRAAAKNLSLRVNYKGAFPSTVRTDPVRLRQILMNLVGNSLKFTESGGVTVDAELVDRGGEPRLEIGVRDTGIGISEEHMSNLFKPFTQSDESMSRRFGGTGLGLAISRRLAEMLGGDIRVSSTAGKGSTFTVTIDPGPLEGVAMIDSPSEAMISRAEAATEAPKSLPAGTRVLLVEDGIDNQRLISHHLRKARAEVVVCENGKLGVEAALDAARGPSPFQIVFMDMQMPVMDGYAAAGALREAGVQTPIIALTAHAMSGDREKCVAAGCDDYMTKPIDRARLVAACARWLNPEARQRAA